MAVILTYDIRVEVTSFPSHVNTMFRACSLFPLAHERLAGRDGDIWSSSLGYIDVLDGDHGLDSPGSGL